jgi:putative Holliday junction resolvase
MRLLGVDFGFKRIGIAIAESEPMIITARAPIEASGTLKKDAARLIEIAKREEVDRVVVGLPLEDGEEGRMARICRTLAGHIAEGGIPVDLEDESMTSVEAEATLRSIPSGDGAGSLKASERRKLKDGEAARLILERYLQMRLRLTNE